MEFIETKTFVRFAKDVLLDDELGQLQMTLSFQPDLGEVIPGSGGLRKVRWFSSGKGKRGGLRIIYYWHVNDEIIFLLYGYKKSKKEDLTKEQIKILKSLVEEE